VLARSISSIFGTQLIHLVRHQEWMRTHAVPGPSAFRPPPECKRDGDRLKPDALNTER